MAVIARGAFHALGGYLYWMSYMPDNFPKSLTAIYPIVYNYSYLLAEGNYHCDRDFYSGGFQSIGTGQESGTGYFPVTR